MLLVALVNGLWYWFSGAQWTYTGYEPLKSCLVCGLINGILFGDVTQGIILGAAIEMVYVGIVAPGGAYPAESQMASAVGIPIAMATGLSVGQALIIVVPFGLIGVFLLTLRRVVDSFFQRRADKYAQEGNLGGITRVELAEIFGWKFINRFPLVFAAVYFGAEFTGRAITAIPEWVMHGITVAGGLMPAMGFALVVHSIGKKSLLPLFFLGFVVVKYLHLSTIACAIIAICVALLLVWLRRENNEALLAKVNQTKDDDE